MRFPTSSSAQHAPALAARWLKAAVLTLALAGCAGYGTSGVRVGQTADEVSASMGAPTGRYAVDGGRTRLEFARGPAGRDTYMVDLDPQGKVERWEQVLDAEHFALVKLGMTSDELLKLLGRPNERRGAGLKGGQIWSWRYFNTDCLWAQVVVGTDGRVRESTSLGAEPQCARNAPAPGAGA
ncbi:MAG: hypothetical protein ABI574_10760 [Burkholderiales bacterium]